MSKEETKEYESIEEFKKEHAKNNNQNKKNLPGKKAKIIKLKIGKKHDRVGEITETLRRVQAEFDNYRKRNDAEKSKFLRMSTKESLLKILPIIDDFELALKNNQEENEFSKGMEHIYEKFMTTIADMGCKPIIALNEKFDPYLHEAVLTKECADNENMVLGEFQKGYTLNDEVIRHSKVKVSKKCENEDNSKNIAKESTESGK